MLEIDRDPASETGPAPSELTWLPEHMGRYEICATLGRGMMGIVYQAWDPLLGRPVALKILRRDLPLEEHERDLMEQRFLREASLAATLSHPNIVVVHDYGRDPETNTPFIAFEYLEGRTLAAIAGEARLDWREALRLTARLARALHHAHARGTIHRDIKPANVMVLPTGEPKLLDFGIARASAVQLSAAGESWGTPSYMSPEQAMAGAVDGRSDLFSLGSVLYELLTGRRAFGGENIVQVMARVLRDEPPPPTSANPTLPADLDAIVARTLAKDPSRRYSDGQALAEDLEDVLEGRPVRARGGLCPVEKVAAEAVPAPSRLGLRLRRVVPALGMGAVLIFGLMLAPGLSAPGNQGPQGAVTVPALSGSFEASAVGAVVNTRVVAPADPAVLAISKPAPVLAPHREPAKKSLEEPSGGPPAPPTAAPLPPATPVPPAKSLMRSAHVALSIEHSYESAQFRAWIDDKLILERALASSETRKLLVLKRRKGTLLELVELRPGERRLRFEVESEGVKRSAELRGVFKSDETRLLQLKLGDRLQLKWKP